MKGGIARFFELVEEGGRFSGDAERFPGKASPSRFVLNCLELCDGLKRLSDERSRERRSSLSLDCCRSPLKSGTIVNTCAPHMGALALSHFLENQQLLLPPRRTSY